jgi:enamine deaminase RidA (YjgF/YER057c/UK114 family)
MSAEARIIELQLELPPAPKPGGVYHPVLVVGNTAMVSGHGPLLPDGTMITGRVGDALSEAEGYQAARQVGLTMLATLRRELGSLDRIERLVKTLGMVNATPNFTNHPQVINGFSNLMVEIWGEIKGKGARSAVGMGSLPSNIAVEVEAIFELKPVTSHELPSTSSM